MAAEIFVRMLSGADVAFHAHPGIHVSKLKKKLAPEFHNVRFYVGQEELQGDGYDLPAGTEICAVLEPCKVDALNAVMECASAFKQLTTQAHFLLGGALTQFPVVISADRARAGLALCARASSALEVLSRTGDWRSHERTALLRAMKSNMAQWKDEELVKNLVSALVRAYGEDPHNCIPDFIWEAVQAKEFFPNSRQIALAVLESIDSRQKVARQPLSAGDISCDERQAYCELLGRYGTPEMDLFWLKKFSAATHTSRCVSQAATEALAQITERGTDMTLSQRPLKQPLEEFNTA